MPQIQLLLEILNLEEAVFIQYKPAEIAWPGPEEFVVTEVKRDREWFKEQLPRMKEFWDKVLWHRENGCDDIMPKTRKPRQTKKKPETKQCEIVSDEESPKD
jgi:hypothetical protein